MILKKARKKMSFFPSYQQGLFVAIHSQVSELDPISYCQDQAVINCWHKSIVFKVCSKQFHISLNRLWGPLKETTVKGGNALRCLFYHPRDQTTITGAGVCFEITGHPNLITGRGNVICILLAEQVHSTYCSLTHETGPHSACL